MVGGACVASSLLIGDTLTCTEARAGLLRYNKDLKVLQFCSGGNWRGISSQEVGDTPLSPGDSCAAIAKSRPGAHDGNYYITRGGQAIAVYCIMMNGGFEVDLVWC